MAMSPHSTTAQLAGRPVNRVGFGAMQLPGGRVFGPPKDHDEAIRVLKRAVRLGANHIDTAQFYGPDVANDLIREALHPYPDDLVIATKVGARRDSQGGWIAANRPEQLVEDVHANLKALALERIDVVNLRVHDDGLPAPFAELLGALIELRDQGKIGGVGISSVTREQFDEAVAQTEIAQVQNLLSVANRQNETLVDETGARGIPFVPYFPLGAAWSNDRVLDSPGSRPASQHHPRSGRPGLVAAPCRPHPAYPGNLLGRPPPGEHGGGADRAPGG
jgi:pyridoxine 4-dehydrogenase